VSKSETSAERGERIVAELREATAEAAGVLKDLTATLGKARAMIDQYAATQVETVMNGYLKLCQKAVDGWNAEMQADMNRLRTQVNERMQELIARLGDLYDIKIIESHEIPGMPGSVHEITGTFVPKS
jgi:hypothetical protein